MCSFIVLMLWKWRKDIEREGLSKLLACTVCYFVEPQQPKSNLLKTQSLMADSDLIYIAGLLIQFYKNAQQGESLNEWHGRNILSRSQVSRFQVYQVRAHTISWELWTSVVYQSFSIFNFGNCWDFFVLFCGLDPCGSQTSSLFLSSLSFISSLDLNIHLGLPTFSLRNKGGPSWWRQMTCLLLLTRVQHFKSWCWLKFLDTFILVLLHIWRN